MEKGSIQCVERTFELLELLARSANPLSLKEISAKLDQCENGVGIELLKNILSYVL